VRVAFLGTAAFAIPTLEALLESGHEVVAVITGPDKPAGRGRSLKPTPVKSFALEAGVKTIWTPTSPRDPEFIADFQALKLDAAVVVAYRILPPEVFDSPKYGTLNVHPSLLPRYRGPAPLNWALINGDKETGVSIIRISEKVDAGGVVKQIKVPLDPNETVAELAERLAPIGGKMVLESLEGLQQGTLSPIEQDEELVTKAPKLRKEDGHLDWTLSARQLHNRIRGVTPWPGAFTSLPDGKTLKLFNTRWEEVESICKPGEIIGLQEKSEVLNIACGEGTLIVDEVQLEGKKRMSVSDFLRGYPLQSDTVLGS